jgi:Ni,Fe-hydrogenase III large subunit
MGLVGPAARAAGAQRSVRIRFAGTHRVLSREGSLRDSGDVLRGTLRTLNALKGTFETVSVLKVPFRA